MKGLQRRLLSRHPKLVVLGSRAELEPLEARLRVAMQRRLQHEAHALSPLPRRLHSSMRLRRAREESRLESLSFRLAALSPLTVLARGYAIVMSESGRVLTQAQSVSLDDPITVRLHQGVLRARVIEPEAATVGEQTAITPTDSEQ